MQPEGSEPILPYESLEELYENAPCGYLSTRPGGTIVRVNQTFLDWTGYSRSELVGKRRLQSLLSIEGQIYFETHLAPLLRMQGSLKEIALDLIAHNGDRLPTLINSVQKYRPDGEPSFVLTTIFDARDRRSYEQELLHARNRAEAAARARARLISMISHDVRTPLSAIRMILPMLERSAQPNQLEMLEVLKSSVDNILELTTDVLEYSRLDSGTLSLEERSFSLRKLIEEIRTRLSPQIEEKGLRFSAQIDERLPATLMGDPLRIGQVLTNLLGNAVKFTATGGVDVTVTVKEHAPGKRASSESPTNVGPAAPDQVEFETAISDTGIGMSEEELSHIFDEFTQGSREIRGRFGGTGLGLTICRRILNLYGSEIQVESVEGEGTTFRFPLRLSIGN